jgi:hypothetical protein
MPQLGKILIGAGALLILAGVIIYFLGNKMTWLGHLPGDIRIEKEHVRFYFPITTMILLSIVFTVVMWIVRKIF